MHMYVARMAEQVILEVVMLKVRHRMGHVRFARQEGLFPDHRAIAADAGMAG